MARNRRNKWFHIGGGSLIVERRYYGFKKPLPIRKVIHAFEYNWIGHELATRKRPEFTKDNIEAIASTPYFVEKYGHTDYYKNKFRTNNETSNNRRNTKERKPLVL